jgi:putative membrane protein
MWCDHTITSWMWIGGVSWLLLIAAGIALVVLMAGRGRTGGDSPTGSSGDRAMAVLRERFASGEIDEASYRERSKLLKGNDF